MKVFFSSELMVWLSLTPIRMAAKLVQCGTIWAGVVQSYGGCTLLTCPVPASPGGRTEWPLTLLRGTVPKLFKLHQQHCSLELGTTFAKLYILSVQISRSISGIQVADFWKFIDFAIYF